MLQSPLPGANELTYFTSYLDVLKCETYVAEKAFIWTLPLMCIFML